MSGKEGVYRSVKTINKHGSERKSGEDTAFTRLRIGGRSAERCAKGKSTHKMVRTITITRQSGWVNLRNCPYNTSILGSLELTLAVIRKQY